MAVDADLDREGRLAALSGLSLSLVVVVTGFVVVVVVVVTGFVDGELVWKVMVQYIPSVLIDKLGQQSTMALLNSEQLQAYRNAIITKKLASMAFYRFGERWEEYLQETKASLLPSLHKIFEKE